MAEFWWHQPSLVIGLPCPDRSPYSACRRRRQVMPSAFTVEAWWAPQAHCVILFCGPGLHLRLRWTLRRHAVHSFEKFVNGLFLSCPSGPAPARFIVQGVERQVGLKLPRRLPVHSSNTLDAHACTGIQVYVWECRDDIMTIMIIVGIMKPLMMIMTCHHDYSSFLASLGK